MEFLITVLIVYEISAMLTIYKIFGLLRDMAEKNSPLFRMLLTSCMQYFNFGQAVNLKYLS